MHSVDSNIPDLSLQSIFPDMVNVLEESLNPLLFELMNSVSAFEKIERAVRQMFMDVASLYLALILESAAFQKVLRIAADKTAESLPGKWKKCDYRTVRFQLFNGMYVSIQCRYLILRHDRQYGPPRKRRQKVGIYPELLALGVLGRVSPWLQSEIGRMVVLLPSMKIVCEELSRQGIEMDVKTVRRIVYDLGERVLRSRRQDILDFRAGRMPIGDALKDKRVVVSIDGGKARTRRNKRGRKTKKGRTRYHTQWREPRLIIIYILDEKGRKDKAFQCEMDATLLGADASMELIAMHLHRLGACLAQSILFVSDGAKWIWDRIENALSMAGIAKKKIQYLLDFYHASQHISEAVNLFPKMTETDRKRQFKRLRNLLLRGRLSEIITYLNNHKSGKNRKAIQTHISYLEQHIQHMDYPRAKRRRLPLGSGAVESAIRRVINLRIKSPGMFWHETNLEAMVVLRARLLSGRWDEMLKSIRRPCLLLERAEWKFEPRSMLKAKTQDYNGAHNTELTPVAA